MADDHATLATFADAWEAYQDRLTSALAPLTAGQLTLRAAPDLRSVGELALHIVGCRMYWFIEFLGEDGGAEAKIFASWNKAALQAPGMGSPMPSAAELAKGLDHTWHIMADCLDRWSPADLQLTFPDEPVEVSRAWVVWHVLEHDLHHGGELSLTLGMHGIRAGFAV